ncbi:SGNH/GDSL hydrolase family protein [Roseivirga ehrenbergii]|nr:SGNH/GDSL hydrolase family protein [Roseivirga ehrenbergii]
MRKKLFKILIPFTIFFFSLELGLMILNALNIIKLEEPIYSFDNSRRFWAENDPDFGVWHSANYSFRHKKECFDVKYLTNSIGARDKERQISASGSRFAVIGDSFAEGWGVEDQDRFSNLLEGRTGIEFMNFAVGGAGLTQEYLIYKKKVMPFEHDAVLWALFPINDIVDDDIEFHAKYSHNRYRAYWVGEYPDYHIEHGLDSVQQSHFYFEKPNNIKSFLKNFTYTYNMLRAFKYVYQRTQVPEFDLSDSPGYFQINDEQWDRTKYSIEKMKEAMGDKKLYIVTIPGDHSYKIYKDHRYEVPLRDSLTKWSAKLGFQYYDLLSEADRMDSTEWKSLYFDCDAHWNTIGHKWAADKIDSVFNISR